MTHTQKVNYSTIIFLQFCFETLCSQFVFVAQCFIKILGQKTMKVIMNAFFTKKFHKCRLRSSHSANFESKC